MLNFRARKWDIVGRFPLVSLISYIVIAIGMVAIILHGGLRLGLSFTGGTDVTVKFSTPTTVAAIKSALQTVGVNDANVITLAKAGDTAGERFTIETQVAFGDHTGKIWRALQTVAPVDRAQSEISSVGPSLSREYLLKAIYALVIAISIQFLYIAFRFGWNYIFGLVTVIALVRDAAMMIGIYGLFNKRADDAFLAAVLTVVGYSVMDTIVILDRIRENTKLMEGQPYSQIVNTSILQTMTRSINTLATVVITLVALLLFGGGSLQNFGFALLVGIVSGGYHSIFFSAPLVLRLREGQLKRAGVKREAARLAGRALPGERPKTVAAARAQASAGLSREQVIAARKERRVKEKTSQRVPSTSGRYKRKRTTSSGAVEMVDVEHEHEHEQEQQHEYEQDAFIENEVDPLDAQRGGVHDRNYDLGHEEINLNFEGHPIADEHSASIAQEQATPSEPHPPETKP